MISTILLHQPWEPYREPVDWPVREHSRAGGLAGEGTLSRAGGLAGKGTLSLSFLNLLLAHMNSVRLRFAKTGYAFLLNILISQHVIVVSVSVVEGGGASHPNRAEMAGDDSDTESVASLAGFSDIDECSCRGAEAPDTGSTRCPTAAASESAQSDGEEDAGDAGERSPRDLYGAFIKETLVAR